MADQPSVTPAVPSPPPTPDAAPEEEWDEQLAKRIFAQSEEAQRRNGLLSQSMARILPDQRFVPPVLDKEEQEPPVEGK